MALTDSRPDQPFRIIVPLAAGSTSDTIARLIADQFRAKTGQPVVIENRPGGYGRIAVRALKESKPDGRTLLMAPLALSVLVPLAAKQLDYDPSADLVPVTQIAEFAMAFAVSPNHPARTMAEFSAWARTHSTAATFGSPSGGGLPHLFGVMIARTAGIDMVHVPYKSAPLVATDLIGGHVSAGTAALSDFIALHRAGKLRIIGTSGTRRALLTPEIPTFKEQGLSSVEGTGWTSLVAPKNTPREEIERLSRLIAAIVQSADVRNQLIASGVEPTGTTAEALSAIIATDLQRWAPVVKEVGFVVD